MSKPSMYALKMAKLSARIFGNMSATTTTKSMKVVTAFSEKPKYKDSEIVKYYPNHPRTEQIFTKLRFIGLYRDEHKEFNEYFKRLREKRGKGKPKKGQGKQQTRSK